MPASPNKLSQFWQELKRRKVVQVITVYAATAFVILELVDIIADPLKLPEWFLTAVIVFLCIGFISIRHEPEFKKIVRDVEAKYQAEHERIRQWLEENDML